MDLFIRSVISGFGQSLGKALFERVKHRLGLGGDEPRPQRVTIVDTDVTDDEDSTPARVIDVDTNVANDYNEFGSMTRSTND